MTSHCHEWAFWKPSFLAAGSLIATLFLLNILPSTVSRACAQATPPITSSGLDTTITQNGNTYNITGGTRPENGLNLFHSFGEFGVPTNNIANFLNDSGLATSNILGRVTGGNISNIFGTIQTTGFGNANLFLMNPTGFLFGINATVNVGGMVAFTSADYLRLADNIKFNGIPNVTADALLSASPVAAFGFLGSNPGAITVQGSQFTVTQETGISLVGGNITIQSGTLDDGTVQPAQLTAPTGKIILASVASAGEIFSSNFQLGANVNSEAFTSLGSITISQDARIDTAGATGGTIAIRGGQLTIRDGATIATAASSDSLTSAGSVTINGAGVQMIGSDVVISGSNVSVTGSQVTAANLNGSGGTVAITAGNADHLGNVTVAQNALLDASGASGGSITIRGGQLAIADATLSANTGNTSGAPVAIDINVTGGLSITDTRAMSTITATTSGTGDAGEVQIAASNVEVSTTSQESFTLIDTHTSGDGRAGDVTIATHAESATGNLLVSGTVTTGFGFIDSGTGGPGTGGDVMLTAKNIDLDLTTISTGDFVARQFFTEPSGSAGNLTISAESFRARNVLLTTEAFAALADTQQAGNITITGDQNNLVTINLLDMTLSAGGALRGGDITFTNFDSLFTDFTFFETFTVFGAGGGITANGRTIELTNGSKLVATTFGDGDAGNISLTAPDHVSLLGQTPANPNPRSVFSPTGLFSNSFGDLGIGNLGASGSIEVTTSRLTLETGGRINSITNSSGRSGNVTINADMVSISGEFTGPEYVIEGSIVDIGDFRPSGIFTKTIGSGESCTGSCGEGGNITMKVGSVVMGPGSQLDAGTSSTGNGGSITVTAKDTLSISGTLNEGSPVGIFSRTIGTTPEAGSGGNIALTAGHSMTISDGASVSASSTGPADAGDISINAGQTFVATNSHDAVVTQADAASGGDITVLATDRVQLTNSRISASVADGFGGGGNISIDPQFVILQNSQILAQAAQGQGGAITIIANLFLPDANSLVNADSGSGVNGTVTIQSPNAPASGHIQPLDKSPLQATSLLNQRCASLAGGEFSSFTVAGRDSLPTEPDSWLASPLATLNAGMGLGAKAEGGRAEGMTLESSPTGETPLLSLRQIAPAGFLTQAFAVDWSASCQS